jgi:hypothetical protein
MGDVRLSSPRVRVIRDGHDDLELQTTNADMVLWDLTRPKQRPPWPKFDEAPMLWMTFLSWAAARRTGAIETSYTWDQWRTDVLEVEPQQDAPDDDGEDGAPFPTGEQSAPDM